MTGNCYLTCLMWPDPIGKYMYVSVLISQPIDCWRSSVDELQGRLLTEAKMWPTWILLTNSTMFGQTMASFLRKTLLMPFYLVAWGQHKGWLQQLFFFFYHLVVNIKGCHMVTGRKYLSTQILAGDNNKRHVQCVSIWA